MVLDRDVVAHEAGAAGRRELVELRQRGGADGALVLAGAIGFDGGKQVEGLVASGALGPEPDRVRTAAAGASAEAMQDNRTIEVEAHVAWKTNSKRGKYEDRYLMPLGALVERLEQADTEAKERAAQRAIDERTARGLVFAVMDGVGGAPLGMAAAQATVDALRELYRRPELAPGDGTPSAREVLALLHEANMEVNGWGVIDDADGVPMGAGASGRPKGAACVTALYLSPAGNTTVLQAGDTAAFVYRARTGRVELYTGAADIAGRSVRKYVGVGEALHIDTFTLGGLESDDLIALVTDGVYPKGFASKDGVCAVLAEAEGNPERAAEELVQRARARGSVDDITALVVAVC